MFRLNTVLSDFLLPFSKVSILQMFRLNITFCATISISYPVSILQMFRLNKKENSQAPDYLELSFNTSDVSVEFRGLSIGLALFCPFQYFRCFGWICLYQRNRYEVQMFQYFRCFGWINRASGRNAYQRLVSILQMFRLNKTA